MAYRFEYDSTSMGGDEDDRTRSTLPEWEGPKESGLTERQKASIKDVGRELGSNWVMRGGIGVNRESVFAAANKPICCFSQISSVCFKGVVSAYIFLLSPLPPHLFSPPSFFHFISNAPYQASKHAPFFCWGRGGGGGRRPSSFVELTDRKKGSIVGQYHSLPSFPSPLRCHASEGGDGLVISNPGK